MGGTAGYARPVQPVDGRMSSWRAHTNRGVPSTEPGTDYYCPIGTPVRAAASGRVVDVGDSINPATGRYVTIDLDDGRRVRYLHLLRRHVSIGDRVQWGGHIADSGASGYGEADWSWNVAETGGAHVHMTLWAHHEYKFGRYATLDPEQYMSSSQGGKSTPATETPDEGEEEDEDMAMKGAHYKNKAGTTVYMLFNEISGFYVEHSGVDGGKYNNPIAQNWDTGSWPEITEAHAIVIKRSLDAVRRTAVTGSLSVDLSDA